MKPTQKKLIGGLLAGLLIATVGAALATGQTDNTTNDTTPKISFEGRQTMNRLGPFASQLTDEQRTELNDLMTTLREQNATPDEIRTAVQEKLDEFGVFDTQLDNEIAQTEQRLTILNRQKELRNEGYSWNEINNITQAEFGLQNATGIGLYHLGSHGFGHEPCGGPRGFMTGKKPEK
jgi:DNA-binding transcriptional MerR regulator